MIEMLHIVIKLNGLAVRVDLWYFGILNKRTIQL